MNRIPVSSVAISSLGMPRSYRFLRLGFLVSLRFISRVSVKADHTQKVDFEKVCDAGQRRHSSINYLAPREHEGRYYVDLLTASST